MVDFIYLEVSKCGRHEDSSVSSERGRRADSADLRPHAKPARGGNSGKLAENARRPDDGNPVSGALRLRPYRIQPAGGRSANAEWWRKADACGLSAGQFHANEMGQVAVT